MATEQEQNSIENISTGISSIITVLKQQAKDITIDIGDVTEVAIGKIITTPGELIESLALPTIVQPASPSQTTPRPTTTSQIPTTTPRPTTTSPIIPNVEGIFKGLLFGVVPKVVIRSYTNKIKYLVTELGKIKVPEQNLEELIDPLAKVSDAVISFSQISWAKAFVSIKALQFFTKSFSSSITKLATPENLKSLSLFERFSKKLSEPLTNISESLNEFANISWAKVVVGTKLFNTFIKGISKVPLDSIKSVAGVLKKLASGLKAPLESLGNTLEKFGDSLNKFVGPLLKGAVAIALLGTSLVPLAYGLKMFAGVDVSSIIKATFALGGLVVLAKTLGGSIASILKGAAAIAILGASILPLTFGLKMIESVGIGTIGVLAAALTTLGIAGAALGFAAPLILTGAGVIAALGASLIPFAFSMKLLSDSNAGEILSSLVEPISKLGSTLLLAAPGLLFGGAALIPFSVGIAALSIAVKVGGDGLISFMEKMGEFTQNLDPGKLFASAGAITALSGAIAAFGAAQAAEGLGNLVGRFLRFGADSPLEQMQKFAAIGDQLKSAGEGILNLSTGISKLSSLGGDIEVLDNFPWDELEKLAKAIEGKAIIQIVTGGGLESKGGMVEAATGKSLGTPSGEVDYSTMSNEEKAKAAGYSSFEEYKQSGWKWKGKTEESTIMSAPSTVGAELAASGAVGGTAPIIINNNNGGNVSTVSNSNVNNSPTPVAPILTGSALGFV